MGYQGGPSTSANYSTNSVNRSLSALDTTFKKLIKVYLLWSRFGFTFLKSGIKKVWKSSCNISGSKQNVSIVAVELNSMHGNLMLLEIWIVSTCLRTPLLASASAMSFWVIGF